MSPPSRPELHLTRPRWLDPRVEGVFVLEHDPRGVLEAIAEHAAAHGYEATAPPEEVPAVGPLGYRVADARVSLQLVASGERTPSVGQRLRLWRIDERALGYHLTFDRTALGWAWLFVYSLALLLAAMFVPRPPRLLWSMAAYWAVLTVVSLAFERRRARSRLRRMVDVEAAGLRPRERAEPASSAPAPTSSDAQPPHAELE